MDELNTINDSLVSVAHDGSIVVLRYRVQMSKEEALRLAAYLVALADDHGQFPALLEAVKST